MKFGYARVSTHEQNLDLQVKALKEDGCEKIITDKISGSSSDRPGLKKLKQDMLREGDTLVVWRLDRLGRSLRDLIDWVRELKAAGIHFHSLQENIDTSNAAGELIFHIFGSLAQFERNLIRERTKAGLEAARARGRLGGRPTKLNDDLQKYAIDLYQRKKPIQQICETLKIGKTTLYRYLASRNKGVEKEFTHRGE